MDEFKLEGMDELFKKLESMGKKASRIENKALRKAGEILKEEVKKEAPRDSGEMAESIEVSKIKRRKGDKYVEIGADKEYFYSKFIEFGYITRNGTNVPANPFMSRSYENKKDEINNTIKNEIKKGLGL